VVLIFRRLRVQILPLALAERKMAKILLLCQLCLRSAVAVPLTYILKIKGSNLATEQEKKKMTKYVFL
jgi:hypothetical protein